MIALGLVSQVVRDLIVSDLSAEEIPVVIPVLDSIPIVIGKDSFEELPRGKRPRDLACSSCIGQRIMPLPLFMRKVIFSSVVLVEERRRYPQGDLLVSSYIITGSPLIRAEISNLNFGIKKAYFLIVMIQNSYLYYRLQVIRMS
jgi:hypothetical protein